MNFFEWLNPNSDSWKEYNAAHPEFTNQLEGNSGLIYQAGNADSFTDAVNTAAQWAREDKLREEGYAREDSAYTRLFKELKSLGVNPALLLSSVSPQVGAANSASTAAIKTNSYAANERTEMANSAKTAGAIIAAIGLILARLL